MLCIATSPSGRGKTRLSLWESWRRSRLRGFDGLRASKTVNGAETTYQYVGDQLLYENRDGTDIYYYYDSYGTPTAIRYYKADGTSHRFFLATNQLGDIIGIYNASGNLVVKYEYDAWGNIIAETNATGGTPTSLAQYWSEINPFRYRGYYYDAETELYYLQSRYYDAEVGRFISSDSQLNSDDLLGFNSYVYCDNCPVNNSDPSGYSAIGATLVGGSSLLKFGLAVLGVIVVAAIAYPIVKQITNVVCDKISDSKNDFNKKEQCVYVLTDSQRNNNVVYVGRTNDPKRRKDEHDRDDKHPERKNYDMTVVAEDLSIKEAKFIEQVLISTYTIGYLENIRREISVKNMMVTNSIRIALLNCLDHLQKTK